MDLDNLCGLVVGLAMFGGFAALFVWVIIQSRKQDAALREVMTGTGYTALGTDDPTIVGRVESIYRVLLHPEQGIGIHNLYAKRDSEGDLHLMDLQVSGTRRRRSSGKVLGRRLVMLTARDLRVPRMHVYPKMGDSGAVAATAVGLRINQLLAHTNLFEVDFEDPEIQNRFRVVTDDPHGVKAFLSGSRMNSLMGLEPQYGFDAVGDTLVMQSYFPRQGISEEQQIAETVRAAQAVHRILSE